jgi:hypothetical protein
LSSTRAECGDGADLVRSKPLKPGEIGQKWEKNAQIPKIIVEIGLFPLTLAGLKSQCNERQGSVEPA